MMDSMLAFVGLLAASVRIDRPAEDAGPQTVADAFAALVLPQGDRSMAAMSGATSGADADEDFGSHDPVSYHVLARRSVRHRNTGQFRRAEARM